MLDPHDAAVPHARISDCHLDSYPLKNERGLSGYHRGQVLTGSYVYPLPF